MRIILLVLLACSIVQAEILTLESGGQIEGVLLEADETPRKTYKIQLPNGAVVTFDRTTVKHVDASMSKNEAAYLDLAPLRPDTLENHLKIADWCERNYLKKYAELHWNRAIELDPENETAHIKLGHNREKGEWISPEERNINRGFIEYKGMWKLPQEKRIDEYIESFAAKERDLAKKIAALRSSINNPAAEREFMAIGDPNAVFILARMLQKEPNPDVRILLVRTLGNIKTPQSATEILKHSMSTQENIDEVRFACYEAIKSNPDAIHFAGNFYSGFLMSDDIPTINIAARAIGKIGATSQIPSLVNRLVTDHSVKTRIGSADRTNVSTDNTGSKGMGFSMGEKTVVQNFSSKNTDVLAALKTLSGVDFGFDVRAWRNWVVQMNRPVQISPRRG